MQRFTLTLSALLVVAGCGDPDPAQVPELIERLALKDAEVRATAVKRLHAIGLEAKAAVPALVGLLGDLATYEEYSISSTVRQDVQVALEAIGSETVSALVQVVAEGTMETAWRAAHVLGRIGPRAMEALPALQKRLTDPDPFVREIIVGSLPQIDCTGTETISLLVARLQDADEEVRAAAAAALGEYGPKAEHTVPSLLQLLRDPEPRVRGYAARTLAVVRGEPDAVLPFLGSLLNDPGVYYEVISSHVATQAVFDDAADALVGIGPTNSVPLLMQRIEEAGREEPKEDDRDETEDAIAAAATTLGRFGPDAHGSKTVPCTATRSGSGYSVFSSGGQWVMKNSLGGRRHAAGESVRNLCGQRSSGFPLHESLLSSNDALRRGPQDPTGFLAPQGMDPGATRISDWRIRD